MNKEINEILEYLGGISEYAIFAGFAGFIYTGIKASLDIDVLFPDRNLLIKVETDFLEKGWKKMKSSKSSGFFSVSMKKSSTTFDLVYTENVKKIIMPGVEKIKHQKYILNVVGCEWLFLSKLNGISFPQRTSAKVARDRRVIQLLRKRINVGKLKKLVMNYGDDLWKNGYI